MKTRHAQACLVLGGTGAVGRFLLPRLRDGRRSLIALSRHRVEPNDSSIEWMQGDLYTEMPDLGDRAIQSMVSVGPLDGLVRWLATASLSDLKRVVALGSMSVVVKADSHDPAERELAERLRQSEKALLAHCADRNIAVVVLRPTLIYGADVDRSLSALVELGMRWRVFPSIPGATGLRQPIHADDVAAACVAALDAAESSPKIYDIGGAERLAFSAMIERTRASLALITLPVRVPLSLARIALRLLQIFPRWQHLSGGLVDRLCVDQTADNAPATNDLDWHPRDFQP
ncbi:MAG: NAD-dependent epimerase/dehydratase family protein [Dokdonella sp.]